MVVGILGGSAGTTYDAFKLIHDAQKHGARVALFGRKINNAEHQLAFIEMLRLITEGKLSPEEAVRAYHSVLEAKKIKPRLPLEKDLALTDQSMSYQGNSSRSAVPLRDNPLATKPTVAPATNPARGEASGQDGQWPRTAGGRPDFENMNSSQRRAYDLARLSKKFG
jgi:hypothetical protein